MTDKLHVLLADDHQPLLVALARLLAFDCEVVGSVTTVAELLDAVNSFLPDIVVVDLNMPDGSGIAACRHIKQIHPFMQVILLTADDDEDIRAAAMEAGAADFVSKSKARSQLPLAIRAISLTSGISNAV